jgi:hypothetical protein
VYVKFLEDSFHPKRRSVYPDYCEGKVYDLSEKDAKYFIREGLATELENPSEETEGIVDSPDRSV